MVGIRRVFTASAFRKPLSIYVFSYFPFGFEGMLWDLIVSVPDHCLSFYFLYGGLCNITSNESLQTDESFKGGIIKHEQQKIIINIIKNINIKHK